MKTIRCLFILSAGLLGIGVSIVTVAAGYNPIYQQAQSNLAKLGYDPGELNGIQSKTTEAITAFQKKEGLPNTGNLDSETLDKLQIGVSTDKVKSIADWRQLPTQAELDKLVSNPINDPAFPYTDYRPNAPAANMDLPGTAILDAMNANADEFGSRRDGFPKHTPQGHRAMESCLQTGFGPTHWSDLSIHYYCQMSKPRACYTYETSGRRPPPATSSVPSPRKDAYRDCAAGALLYAPDFAWVTRTQPLIFQYVMFGQTHAFNHEQEQAIINAFYGVDDPKNPTVCTEKRPRRTEDPSDGTHCQVDKTMSVPLAGRGR